MTVRSLSCPSGAPPEHENLAGSGTGVPPVRTGQRPVPLGDIIFRAVLHAPAGAPPRMKSSPHAPAFQPGYGHPPRAKAPGHGRHGPRDRHFQRRLRRFQGPRSHGVLAVALHAVEGVATAHSVALSRSEASSPLFWSLRTGPHGCPSDFCAEVGRERKILTATRQAGVRFKVLG